MESTKYSNFSIKFGERFFMTKKAKLITIITSAVVALALIILAICLSVANSNREKTNTSIVSVDAGSHIHFVLNGNDKVTRVVPLDDNAKGIALNNQMNNLKYVDAVKLFVTKSTEAGYIDINTTGYTATVTLGGDKKNYSKLQSELVSAINGYFDQMGIIAGANVTIKDNLVDFVKELKPTAQNTESKSNSGLMTQYLTIFNLVEDIRPSDREAFYTAYDTYDAEYQTTITERPKEIAEIKEYINTLTEEINALTTEISNLPDGSDKTAKQTELNDKIALRNNRYATIDRLQKDIDSANIILNTKVADARNTYVNNKETINNELTNTYNANITANKDIIESHTENFNNNKSDIQSKITDYRNSINK